MCGIAGIANWNAEPPSQEQIRRMCATLRHRGPDGEGVSIADGVGLGTRRLAIIDIAGGHQPMCDSEGSLAVSFNGEIYNFRELRRALEGQGHRFRTRSDTEVLLHGYRAWQHGLLERLDGMFAFAIHDRQRRLVLLARDPVGIKPLFWANTGRQLVWGSEIKAVLASGLVPKQLDPDSLVELLTWEYVSAPATLLAGVHKLEPGCAIELDLTSGRLSHRRYWDLPAPAQPAPREDWAGAIDEAITASVQSQLVSDVPLGAFLSGGVDSSLVTAKMGPVKAFSIGFADPSYDELHWARRVARHLGVDQRVAVASPDLIDHFADIVEMLDDPIADVSVFPTYLVSRLARQEVTVVLSGDGGDELFGGYETYRAQRLAGLYGRLPRAVRQGLIEPAVRALRPRPAKKGVINKARRFVEGMSLPVSLAHARWRCFLEPAVRVALLHPDVQSRLQRSPFDPIERAQARARGHRAGDAALAVDLLTYLPDNILVKVDRMTMAVSLEARVPYLSPRVIDLAFRVPEPLKIGWRGGKRILKEVAARYVPRDCVERPKEGFSAPVKQWLEGPLRPLLDELLAADRLRGQGLFEPSAVERLRREHRSGEANHGHLLWALCVFQSWWDRWYEG